MNAFLVELQVAPGLAEEFEIASLHYGLLAHLRTSDRTGTREIVEFWPFRTEAGEVIKRTGVGIDEARVEEERATQSDLDNRLVRRSIFTVELADTNPLGKANLQQVFLLVKPKGGGTFSRLLQMTLHVSPGQVAPTDCLERGPEPFRLWSRDQWRDVQSLDGVRFEGNLAEYLEKIKKQLNEIAREWAEPGGEEDSESELEDELDDDVLEPDFETAVVPTRPAPTVSPQVPPSVAPTVTRPREQPTTYSDAEAIRWQAADAIRRGSWFVWRLSIRRTLVAVGVLTLALLWIFHRNVIGDSSRELQWDTAFWLALISAVVLVAAFLVLGIIVRAELDSRLPAAYPLVGSTRRDLRYRASHIAQENQIPVWATYGRKLRAANDRLAEVNGSYTGTPLHPRIHFPFTYSVVALLFVAMLVLVFGDQMYGESLVVSPAVVLAPTTRTASPSRSVKPERQRPAPGPSTTPQRPKPPPDDTRSADKPPVANTVEPTAPSSAASPPVEPKLNPQSEPSPTVAGQTAVQTPSSEPAAPPSADDTVRGVVLSFERAEGWPILQGRVLQLEGVRRIDINQRPAFEQWIKSRAGTLTCWRKVEQFYTCLTQPQPPDNKPRDVAEAILANGGGEVSDSASERYKLAEQFARRQGRGIWKP